MSVRLGRLRYRSEFLRVAGGRRKCTTPGIILQALPHESPLEKFEVRVGFTVTRRVGNAVVRNRVRRRLRAIAATVLPLHAKPGHDFVFIGKAQTVVRPYNALVGDLETALRKLDMWRSSVADTREICSKE